MSKANGLQDHDVGFPNTPVRRYIHRKNLEKELYHNPSGWSNVNQTDTQAQQQPTMQQQPAAQQPTMQQPTPQQQAMMQQQAMQQQALQQQALQQIQANNLQSQQQQFQQIQDPNRCAQKQVAGVENGIKDIITQNYRPTKCFDPEASLMKQRGYEGQWQFQNSQRQSPEANQKHANQTAQEANAVGAEPQQNQHHHHQHGFDTNQHMPGFSKRKPFSKFLHPYQDCHIPEHMQVKQTPPPAEPVTKAMQQGNSAAATQNHQGQNPPSEGSAMPQEQKDIFVDYSSQNNPYLMGQNPQHHYQSMYPGNYQTPNQYNQPMYYMNQAPTAAQLYPQAYMGLPPMQMQM